MMTLQNTQPLALSSSTLTGDRVLNLQDEDIGKVEEIMIDIRTGYVAYVVLSFGGILGIGDKLFAVPWSALEVDTERKVFILDANKELLERAPGFDKNNWPETPNGQWYHDVYKFYEEEPYWLQS
ncbi:MAG: PRC-barrel domain-containing protein [Anaerolineae bacterium]|nr:PRC-barrel domain-containing protein [Anaerolineae bacterium]